MLLYMDSGHRRLWKAELFWVGAGGAGPRDSPRPPLQNAGCRTRTTSFLTSGIYSNLVYSSLPYRKNGVFVSLALLIVSLQES